MRTKPSNSLISGACLVILGIILSGPPMVILIDQFHPQPDWVDIETFITHFHRLQTLPFWFGFLLIIGNILYIVSVCRLTGFRNSIRAALAIISLCIYATLISLNYLIQTITVPLMVLESSDKLDLFSMANPASICWSIEMVGYAVLGISYWLAAVAFTGKEGIFQIIKYLMIFNGVVSLLAVLIPVIDPSLLLDPGGLIGYYIWNLLIVVIMVLSTIAIRRMKVEGAG